MTESAAKTILRHAPGLQFRCRCRAEEGVGRLLRRDRRRHGRFTARTRRIDALHPFDDRNVVRFRHERKSSVRLRIFVRAIDGRVVGKRLEALPRSEEHTSELQSLMRISYAVFCLKQKK